MTRGGTRTTEDGELEWCWDTGGDAAEYCSGGDGEGGRTNSDDREEYYAICG